MSRVVNIDDYRKKELSHDEQIHQMAIEVHKSIVEMHEDSVLNYEQHKMLLQRLNEILNEKGSKK